MKMYATGERLRLPISRIQILVGSLLATQLTDLKLTLLVFYCCFPPHNHQIFYVTLTSRLPIAW